jgi:hypothetical protein
VTRRVLGLATVAAVCLAARIVAHGAGGLLYVLIVALAVLPGLPLGVTLFGRRQPAAWVAGALIGYVLTSFAIWVAIASGRPSRLAFTVAWLVISATTCWLVRPRRDPLAALPEWTGRASTALAAVLLVTLLVAVPPFARVGERDPQGNTAYRAYFTADFVWHTALTAELGKFSSPPRNPYLASEPIHYYWTYFLIPAAVSQTGPAPVRDVQTCLKVNALITGVLLMSSVFMLAWAATASPGAVAASVLLVLLAGSFEGAYEINRLWARGEPLSALKDINIDAITAWHFEGSRIDGLPRCLWYVPQHSMAYSLGLVALTAAVAAGATTTLSAVAIQGLALAGAVALNPFVGGIFACVWGVAVLVDAVRKPAPVAAIVRHAAAVVPVSLALLWCVGSRMVEGAGGALDFGFHGASRHAPMTTLFLSLGPVLIPAAAALVFVRRDTARGAVPSIALTITAMGLLFLVRLRVDQAWVGFRAGQMVLVGVPPLIALGLSQAWTRRTLRPVAGVAFALLLLFGLPTTAIDAYNAQDITNHDAGPGFRWTIVLDPEQQQALTWIRRATPRDAVVQMEPVGRDREDWSLIPSFAERRMAGGLPISLINVPAYQATSSLVQQMFATSNAAEAAAIAHHLRIDYIYVDAADRARYPGAAKFDSSPEQFQVGFRRGPVAVYLVK